MGYFTTRGFLIEAGWGPPPPPPIVKAPTLMVLRSRKATSLNSQRAATKDLMEFWGLSSNSKDHGSGQRSIADVSELRAGDAAK